MQWFHALMPKEEQFVQHFCRHAETLVAGAQALRLLLNGDDIDKHSTDIMRHEDDADQVARDTMLAVHKTFITPFDRGDITALVGSLDDAIDQMKKTAKAIHLYEVKTFEPFMREMADVIVEAATLTREAMPLMHNMRKHVPAINDLHHRIIKAEEKADQIYDRGMKALFLSARDAKDPMAYIVGAEIYDHLEKVVDRFEDVANRISGILVENL